MDTLRAGIAGIGTAIKLREAGFDNFEIVEKSHDFGGTWLDNSYPGAACDVPAHLYTLSFEPNPDWTESTGLPTTAAVVNPAARNISASVVTESGSRFKLAWIPSCTG